MNDDPNSTSSLSSLGSPEKVDLIVNPIDTYRIHTVAGDGNCLFRSVALCLTGSENEHKLIRKLVAQELLRASKRNSRSGRIMYSLSTMMHSIIWVEPPEQDPSKPSFYHNTTSSLTPLSVGKNNTHIPSYNSFVSTDYEDYCNYMASSGIWGGNIELQAIANIFGLSLLILQDSHARLIIHPDENIWCKEDIPERCIILLFRGQSHYDAILPIESRMETLWDKKPTRDEYNRYEKNLMLRFPSILCRISLRFNTFEHFEDCIWYKNMQQQQKQKNKKNKKKSKNDRQSQEQEYSCDQEHENSENTNIVQEQKQEN